MENKPFLIASENKDKIFIMLFIPIYIYGLEIIDDADEFKILNFIKLYQFNNSVIFHKYAKMYDCNILN